MPNDTVPAAAGGLPEIRSLIFSMEPTLAEAVDLLHALTRVLGGDRGPDADDVSSMYALVNMAMGDVRKAKEVQEQMLHLILGRMDAVDDPAIRAASRFETLWQHCVSKDEDVAGNAAWSVAIAAAEANLAGAVPTSILGAERLLGVLMKTSSSPLDSADTIMRNVVTGLSAIEGRA